ncbi:MAG: acyl-CoA dehydrogenase [Bdellovibrionaceae bacterium]|nr:acyl-CoA dehydrogenase [Pseudobdellovibrionaceae bacterium]
MKSVALTQLSEEEESFQLAVRQFAEKEIKPLSAKMDEDSEMDRKLLPKLFEMGLMSMEIPEQYGGVGISFMNTCLAIEELARVDASVSVMVDVQNTLVSNAFNNWASEEQKKQYLPLLAENKIGAYALSETGSGSDAFALQTKAVEQGDFYHLTGQKMWITNAEYASVFLVFATVDPKAGYKGITAFIVDKDCEGFSIGKKENKLGIRASSTCELILENCKISKKNVLGAVGKGYKVAIETLNEGRIGIAAQMLGIAQGAYDASKQYIKEREQFGKSLSQFQAVQFQLADMRVQLDLIRLAVYNAARLKENKQDFIQAAATAKLVSSEFAEKICSMTINLFGGNGFSKEYPVERFYRDVKIGQIYEGTSNMQRQTIAKFELS